MKIENTVNEALKLLQQVKDQITSGNPSGLSTIDELFTKLNSLKSESLEREAKFHALFIQSADPIMTLAPPEWKFTSCNPAALKIFEVSDEATFTQLGPWDLSPESQPDNAPSSQKAPQMIATAMERGSHFFEWEHKTLTGKKIACTVLLSRVDISGSSYLQATVRDISREHSMKIELSHKTKELEGIFLNSPLGITRLNSQYQYLSVNPAFEKFVGYTEAELKSLTVLDITHPDDYQNTFAQIKEFPKESQSIAGFEKRYIHKSGKVVWGRVSSSTFKDSNGESVFISVIEDITELKHAQIENETIFESMSEGLVIHGYTGKIEKFTPEALKILGLTSDQLLGRTSSDPNWKSIKEDGSNFPGDEHPAMVALRTGSAVRNTIMGLTLPSGEERWIKINAVPFGQDHDRKVVCTFGDITEIVKVNRDMKHIFSHSRDLICIASTDGTFKKVSPSFKKILGHEEDQLLSRPFIDFIHPDDVEATRKVVETLAQGIPLVNFENRYRKKSGDYLIISWVCEPDPKTGFLYATGRDVTELRESEVRNNQILSALDKAAIIAFTDTRGKITKVNESFCKISGYSSEELIGKDHRILNSGVHTKGFFENLWKTIQSGKTWSGDIENRNKAGQSYHVRSVITPLHDVNGKIDQFMAIRFDVTEAKRAEMSLVEAQKIAKIGSWKYDLHSGDLTWSSEHYRIFEIDEPQTKEDLYRLYRERIHPEDRAELDRIVDRAIKLGEDFVYNHRVYLDGGVRIKNVRGIGKVIKNKDGKPLYISGTCQDLSDVVILQEQNKFILKSMGIGIWKFNPVTQDLQWDQSLYDLYELNPKDFSAHYQAWESSLSPEAKQKAVEELGLALSGKKEFDTTFEILTKSGVRKQIGGKGIVIRNDKNEPIMMYGINWDKTKEFTMQAALFAKSQELQNLIDGVPVVLSHWDANLKNLAANSGYSRIVGKTPAEMHGKHYKEILGPVYERVKPFIEKALAGETTTTQTEITLKNGEVSHSKVTFRPDLDANNNVRGIFTVAVDITEDLRLRKELELERAKSLHSAKLASLGEMSAGIAHEVNNPLAIISGSLPLLSKFKDNPEKFASKIESVHKATIRIEKIVKGLKKFSRASSGVIHKNEKLKDIIEEVMILTEAKSKRHSTPVTLSMKDSLVICCDGVEIEQVFVNLINNAIDAVKKNSEKWVKINAFEDQGHVVVQVMDSGVGLTEEVETKLFHPFFTTKPVGEGTGLGLSIAKGILDQHKASIAINHSSKNTCFEIRFPKVENKKSAA